MTPALKETLGRFAVWCKSGDPHVEGALIQLGRALAECDNADALNGIEHTLTRMGSSAASHASELRERDKLAAVAAEAKRKERNKAARDARTQKVLDTPLSELISAKINRRRRVA